MSASHDGLSGTPPLNRAEELPVDSAATRSPVKCFRCSTDRTTFVEAVIWQINVTSGDDATGVEYGITFTRSTKDGEGNWHSDAGSNRIHDLPVVVFLLQKCHAWCLDQRSATPI